MNLTKRKIKAKFVGFILTQQENEKNESKKRSLAPYCQRPLQYISTWHRASENSRGTFGDILW